MWKSSKTIKSFTAILLTSAIVPIATAGGSPAYAPDLTPPNPNIGECYARVEVPAQFVEGTQQVMTEEGYSLLDVQQPQLASRQEQVMIKEASTRFRVRQPSYRSTTEQILVRPAYDKLSVSKPQFSTVVERVETSSPRLIWKRGNPSTLASQGYTIHTTSNGSYHGHGLETQFTSADGRKCGINCEIWCLVEEPGEAVEYNRKVMTSPGRVQRTPVPAKYQTIHKQVVSDPGGVEEIPVPAQYRSVTVQDVIHPGGENTVNVPPKFSTVTTKTLTSPERYEWRRVLCAPGTGSIKTSADFASPSSSYATSLPTHSSSQAYTQPSYSSSHSTYSAPQTSSHTSSSVVTGTGYYGGYNEVIPDSDNVSHHKNKSLINEHSKRKHRRYRK